LTKDQNVDYVFVLQCVVERTILVRAHCSLQTIPISTPATRTAHGLYLSQMDSR